MTQLSTKTFAAALLAATMMAPAAMAADTMTSGPYIAGQIGANIPTGDDGILDNTATFAGAVGYRINPNLRVEGEVSYRKNDYSENVLGLTAAGDESGTALLANVWYDFANASPFTPYIGGGIGLARGSMNVSEPVTTTVVDDSDTAFVWQVGTGLAYNVTQNLAVTADYRYMDTSNFTLNATVGGVPAGSSEDDYRAHEMRVGMRYSF